MFSSSLLEMPSPSSVFAAYASISALIMLLKNMINQLVPQQLQQYIVNVIRCYFKTRTDTMSLVVEQYDGITRNEVYDASETYLCDVVGDDAERLRIYKQPKEKNLVISFGGCETMVDSFQGIELKWRFISEKMQEDSTRGSSGIDLRNSFGDSEKRYFELTFDKKQKEKVLDSYIPFVLDKAKNIKNEKKTLKLHTLAQSIRYCDFVEWDSINFEHPSTFDTVAMDPEMKEDIIGDLDRFINRKEYYRKVGKAWKRGYLLYGPPGTGKSSLIAAMANYLNFDIYDLQLMNIKHDSDWRKLLLSTANKSILVIEDIDCSVELPDRKCSKEYYDKKLRPEERPRDPQFSLSGLLNFIDGLWSSCGDERIIIFTTNNKDKLDPALLRPGRMDKHIYMPYLTMKGFELLASNYLEFQEQPRQFKEIQELVEAIKVSPAEVAEELMKSDDVDVSLEGVVDFLRQKKIKSEETVTEGTEDLEQHEANMQGDSANENGTIENAEHLPL